MDLRLKNDGALFPQNQTTADFHLQTDTWILPGATGGELDRLTVRNVAELRRLWEAGDRDSALVSLPFFWN